VAALGRRHAAIFLAHEPIFDGLSSTMVRFKTLGPFEVPHDGSADKKYIRTDDVRGFWEEHADIAARKGVYVFGVRAGRGGYTPIYVGKATRTFGQETFTVRNLHHYNHGLRDWKASRPVVIFIAHPEQRGPANRKAIGEVEVFFIKLGKKANPNLKNTHHTSAATWEVDSMQPTRGSTKAVRVIRKMMKIG
jgi:hypothetical protein